MSRPAKFALFAGLQVSWILAAIYALNLLGGLDAALARALGLEADAATLRAHPLLQYFAIAALGFGVAWTSVDLGRPAWRTLVAGGAFVQVFTLCGVLALFGSFFSPWLPALATVAAWVVGVSYARSEHGRRREAVESIFSTRISPESGAALAAGRTALGDVAAGQARDLTLVICEIFNHGQLLDALSPADYLRLTNAFLERTADALRAAGGCVVSCNGEGVTAVFGGPVLGQGNHAAAGCRAALEVARRVGVLNDEWTRERNGAAESTNGIIPADGAAIALAFPGCDVRIGVNSGEMVTGRFGPAARDAAEETLAGYGVAGEEVAFTRRLCAANLVYGSTILLGAQTYELAEAEMEARPLELLRRRVGDDWLEVYELLGEPNALSEIDHRRRELFWNGVIFYRERRLTEALEHFVQARLLDDRVDGPLDFYIRRIDALRQQNPAHEWETTRMLHSL